MPGRMADPGLPKYPKKQLTRMPQANHRKPQINYKNQNEIMQKIFGSNDKYQDYKALVHPSKTEVQQKQPTYGRA